MRDGAYDLVRGRSTLSRGTHTITATVTDSHGLTGTTAATVVVD